MSTCTCSDTTRKREHYFVLRYYEYVILSFSKQKALDRTFPPCIVIRVTKFSATPDKPEVEARVSSRTTPRRRGVSSISRYRGRRRRDAPLERRREKNQTAACTLSSRMRAACRGRAAHRCTCTRARARAFRNCDA